ncbi:hypothetical protein ES705_45124 [subsurface metagenome]
MFNQVFPVTGDYLTPGHRFFGAEVVFDGEMHHISRFFLVKPEVLISLEQLFVVEHPDFVHPTDIDTGVGMVCDSRELLPPVRRDLDDPVQHIQCFKIDHPAMQHLIAHADRWLIPVGVPVTHGPLSTKTLFIQPFDLLLRKLIGKAHFCYHIGLESFLGYHGDDILGPGYQRPALDELFDPGVGIAELAHPHKHGVL